MTSLVQIQTLANLPSCYGKEPPEGRKFIPFTINWGVDQDWKLDCTLLQSLHRFSFVQTLYINALNSAANRANVYLDNQLFATIPANSAPLLFPIFGGNPTKLEFFGNQGGTATGTLQCFLTNFAIIPAPPGV